MNLESSSMPSGILLVPEFLNTYWLGSSTFRDDMLSLYGFFVCADFYMGSGIVGRPEPE